MNRTLVDSSYLYALYSTNDANHQRVLKHSRNTTDIPLIPELVLPEVAFLFRRDGGTPAVTAFLRNFAKTFVPQISLTKRDILHAEAIMTRYASAKLDFVDCAIMAIAERLEIQHIATFDRRDFSIVRPAHVEHFILLPE